MRSEVNSDGILRISISPNDQSDFQLLGGGPEHFKYQIASLGDH
ncbi:MAG: hypothetical protein ACK4VO_00025 [Pseudobdellovibrio sp.]